MFLWVKFFFGAVMSSCQAIYAYSFHWSHAYLSLVDFHGFYSSVKIWKLNKRSEKWEYCNMLMRGFLLWHLCIIFYILYVAMVQAHWIYMKSRWVAFFVRVKAHLWKDLIVCAYILINTWKDSWLMFETLNVCNISTYPWLPLQLL